MAGEQSPRGNFNSHGRRFDGNSSIAYDDPVYAPLRAISPGFTHMVHELHTQGIPGRMPALVSMLKEGQIDPGRGYILAFPTQNGEVLHRFSDSLGANDIRKNKNFLSGATVTVAREMVPDKATYDRMQAEGSLSKFAPWVEGGAQYIVGAHVAIRDGDTRGYTVNDPYKYLDPSLNAKQKEQALRVFDPRDAGLQLNFPEHGRTGVGDAIVINGVRGLNLFHTGIPTGAAPGAAPAAPAAEQGGFDPNGLDKVKKAPTGRVFGGPG